MTINPFSFQEPSAPHPASHAAPYPLHKPVLKVLGLGGGGCNTVNRMIDFGLKGVEFIAANTDNQALQSSLAPTTIRLGPTLTRGLGAGGKANVGEEAAVESHHELEKALRGADMIFLTAGMGGGTGTGSIPVAAEIARSMDAVTIAVVTTPFSFEMGRRQGIAMDGLAQLRKYTHTLITIPNDKLLYVTPDVPLETAFRVADDVLRQAIQGITELITEPGLINVDFAHIRRLMKVGGGALMSIGQGEGEDKAQMAVHKALTHPLLDTVPLENASGVIANFTGGDDLTLIEVSNALQYLQEQAGDQAEVVMGMIKDDRLKDRVQVILVITDLGTPTLEEVLPGAEWIRQSSQPPKDPDLEPLPTQEVAPPAEKTPWTPPINNLDLPAFMRRRTRFKARDEQEEGFPALLEDR